MSELDPGRCWIPFAAYYFMDGFSNAVCYAAAFMWPAFHTGNVIQMAIAIGRLFYDPSFQLADKQAAVSLVAFVIGASFIRIGDRMGSSTRAWMCLGTILQALCTMAAALCAWKCGELLPATRADPGWSNILAFAAIGFISASLGLQAIMAMRVKSPFGTTILVTTFWCDLAGDSKLFTLRNPARDRRVVALFALFLGGFLTGSIIDKIGAAGTLGVGTMIRVFMAVGWLFAPAKPTQDIETVEVVRREGAGKS
ncbi:hypothetical protein NM688_g4122 [Phlebia brevispora]|uniref:Uncharacterized protein n=1 Tax=Phlebia brevispora TaxID=194682 RepID=A0ACC1T475_9APHY|nr:hypothetical protein NM688_g4122 [Phlebia brevispora]